jgi:hypothetical protein
MHGDVDLVVGSQPVCQRLHLLHIAGREAEIAAFFGKRFRGRRADTLGCARDQDALAAQMKIHGMPLDCRRDCLRQS